MTIRKIFFLAFLLIGQTVIGQKIDINIYTHFLKVDNSDFLKYALSVGLQTRFDSLSNTLFARTKGIVYSKPLADTGNAYYVLTMLISTLDKNNNKTILMNAKPVEGKKNTWMDNDYLYIEWDTENAISKEIWYKVLVYRRK